MTHVIYPSNPGLYSYPYVANVGVPPAAVVGPEYAAWFVVNRPEVDSWKTFPWIVEGANQFHHRIEAVDGEDVPGMN